MTKKQNDKPITRRSFLQASTLVATGSAIAYGAVSVPLLRSKDVLLRPPGALNEDLFLASCIKCGQCLQVCPPQVIELAGIRQGFGIGTPYIVPSEGACILCSGLPCVLACPTGALDHHLSLGKDAAMGLAVITAPDTCLSVLGKNDLIYRLGNLQKNGAVASDQTELSGIVTSLVSKLTEDEKKMWQNKFSVAEITEKTLPQIMQQLANADLNWLITFVKSSNQAKMSCQVCLDVCPIKDEKTISFITKTNPNTGKSYTWPSVNKTCVGCGVCEEKCPTAIASIKVSPQMKWSERSSGS